MVCMYEEREINLLTVETIVRISQINMNNCLSLASLDEKFNG